MSYVFKHLPPFAADYSGVASAFHDLGGLVVIHDASGCTGSFTGYDEPRWFSGRSSVYCSGLREFDAIMGNDERLLENIRELTRAREFRFVAIVGSPVPMLVGFDFDGFANLVEHETGIPAFGFPTTGLEGYHRGLAAAYLALARRFVVDSPARARSVNILGASPLDNFDAESVRQLRACLAELGLPVCSVWGQGNDFAALECASAATVNLVVASSALPLARYMEKRWSIPYVECLPIGSPGRRRLKAALSTALGVALDGGKGDPPDDGRSVESLRGAVCLIGEQMFANAVRATLARRVPELTVTVASFFAWDAGAARAGDACLANESAAIDFLAEGRFDAVVGDPLFVDLLPAKERPAFVPEPHYAVSGRLHRDHTQALRLGPALSGFVEQIIDAVKTRRSAGAEKVVRQ